MNFKAHRYVFLFFFFPFFFPWLLPFVRGWIYLASPGSKHLYWLQDNGTSSKGMSAYFVYMRWATWLEIKQYLKNFLASHGQFCVCWRLYLLFKYSEKWERFYHLAVPIDDGFNLPESLHEMNMHCGWLVCSELNFSGIVLDVLYLFLFFDAFCMWGVRSFGEMRCVFSLVLFKVVLLTYMCVTMEVDTFCKCKRIVKSAVKVMAYLWCSCRSMARWSDEG